MIDRLIDFCRRRRQHHSASLSLVHSFSRTHFSFPDAECIDRMTQAGNEREEASDREARGDKSARHHSPAAAAAVAVAASTAFLSLSLSTGLEARKVRKRALDRRSYTQAGLSERYLAVSLIPLAIKSSSRSSCYAQAITSTDETMRQTERQQDFAAAAEGAGERAMRARERERHV